MLSAWSSLLVCTFSVVASILPGCEKPGKEGQAESSPQRIEKTADYSRPIHIDPSLQDRIRTEPAAIRIIAEIVHAPGEVVLDPQQVAIVTSRIEGQIDHLSVRLGDHVRIGQRLTTIVSLHLDELVQEYLVTKAQADVAEDSFRRSEKLVGEKVAPLRQLVETRGRHRETQAHFQHVREKLINMGLTSEELRQLERSSHEENHRYTLKAPIAGTVITQNVVRGQGVAPGQQLFQIVDTSRLWIFANLPLEQGKRFKEGDMGTILPKGGDPIKAPLTYVAPVADEKTRTVQVRFEVPNVEGRLKPHEFVEVTLALNGVRSLAVPVSAVTMAGKTRGVFVQREEAYHFVLITTGREGDGWIEVVQGLQAGDLIVTEGLFDLKNVLLREHIETGEGG